MPPVDFDLWLHVVQLTFQILQYGIFFFKVHFISLQECSLYGNVYHQRPEHLDFIGMYL
jgi:hypothetical protein